MRSISFLFPLALMACSSTASDTAQETPTLAPPLEGEGFQFSMEATVEPFSEAWICSIYPLEIEEPANVNWAKFLQNEGTHHMLLPFTPPHHRCNRFRRHRLGSRRHRGK